MATIADLTVKVGADIANALSGFSRVESGISGLTRMAGSAATALGGAFVAGGAALVGFGALAVNTGMQFEKSMSAVGAISEATGEQMKALRDTALSLGESTSKSAKEVADAMTELAKGGMNVNEVIGAMPGIISASEASGESMATVTQVMSSALNAFGLEATESTRVADILAKTANVSAAGINDLGYTFKYAAPLAKQLGISMEQLAASTAIMSDVGIKGEQAGTTLRAALIRLAAPPKAAREALDALQITTRDASGNMVSFDGILTQLSKSLEGMGSAQKSAALSAIFGAEAMSGMLALIDAGPEKFRALTKEIENSGGASADTAKKMKDNLAGDVEEMTGAWETLQISIGTGLPGLRPATQALTAFIQNLTANLPGIGATISAVFSRASAALSPFADMITGAVLPALRSIADVAVKIALGDLGFGTLATLLSTMVQPALTFIQQKFTELQAAMSAFAPTGERIGAAFNTIVAAITPLIAQFTTWLTSVNTATAATTTANAAWQGLARDVNAASGAIAAIIGWFNQSWQAQTLAVGAVTAYAAATTIAAAASAAHAIQVGVTAAATSAYTAVQWALNAALTANPIGIVIVALAALAAAFVYAYANSEEFRAAIETLGTTCDIIGQGMVAIGQRIAAEMGAAFTTLSSTADIAGQALSAMFARVIAAASEAIAAIINFGGQVIATLHSVASQAGAAATAIGTAIVQGIISGMSNGIPSITAAAMNLGAQAVAAAKAALDARSPSKKMMEVGEDAGEGLAIGLDDSTPGSVNAVVSHVKAVKDAATKELADMVRAIKDQLSEMNRAWDEAFRKAKDFATGMLTGEKAASDALFENEQEALAIQKKINDLKLAGAGQTKLSQDGKRQIAANQALDDALKMEEEKLTVLRLQADQIRIVERLANDRDRRALRAMVDFSEEMSAADRAQAIAEELEIMGSLVPTIRAAEEQLARLERKGPNAFEAIAESATEATREIVKTGKAMEDMVSGASGGRKGSTKDLMGTGPVGPVGPYIYPYIYPGGDQSLPGGAGLGDTLPLLGGRRKGATAGEAFGEAGETPIEAEAVSVTSTGPVNLTSTLQPINLTINLPGGEQIVALVLAEPPAVAALANGIGAYNALQGARGG